MAKKKSTAYKAVEALLSGIGFGAFAAGIARVGFYAGTLGMVLAFVAVGATAAWLDL